MTTTDAPAQWQSAPPQFPHAGWLAVQIGVYLRWVREVYADWFGMRWL